MPYKQTQSSSITTSTVGDKTRTTSSNTTSKRKLTRGQSAGGLLTTIGQIQMIGITMIVISIGSAVDQFTLTDLEQTTPNYNVQNTYIPINDPLNNINYQQYGAGVVDAFFHETTGYIVNLNAIAEAGENIVSCFKDLSTCFNRSQDRYQEFQEDVNNPQVGTFADEFGGSRLYELSFYASSTFGYSPYQIYLEMTTAERTFVQDNLSDLSNTEISLFTEFRTAGFYFFGFNNPFNNNAWQWGYFQWPTILNTIIELGV
jgi:hypothetical protein